MGIHNKLADGIDEVDVIIAGGKTILALPGQYQKNTIVIPPVIQF